VKGVAPGTSALELGEIAINTNEGKIFIKTQDSDSNVAVIDFQPLRVYNSSGTRIN
jgi:DNA-binding beta-propeller fold protein YncE